MIKNNIIMKRYTLKRRSNSLAWLASISSSTSLQTESEIDTSQNTKKQAWTLEMLFNHMISTIWLQALVLF